MYAYAIMIRCLIILSNNSALTRMQFHLKLTACIAQSKEALHIAADLRHFDHG